MIPTAYITNWRTKAPWPTNAQVEQDLVLSRALVEIFNIPLINQSLAFRGGTALHKLIFDPPGRYSEDVDLVQVRPGEIGSLIDALRSTLDGWLGEPKRKRNEGRVTLLYRFETTNKPVQSMRLKIEINTGEHFSELGYFHHSYAVSSPWFNGTAKIPTYHLEELLATKLRALHQRKKGRDLFDLWLALSSRDIDTDKLLLCFERYMERSSKPVSRAEFEKTLAAKMEEASFLGDMDPLLARPNTYNPILAHELVQDKIISHMKGEPWRRSIRKVKPG
jgi:predicted nucleotidyltransferase component of viral defense system